MDGWEKLRTIREQLERIASQLAELKETVQRLRQQLQEEEEKKASPKSNGKNDLS